MRTSTTVWSEAYLFFFFQAEDGIRDLTVTGVQTLLFRSRELMDLSVTEPTGVGADHISIFSMALDASRGVIYGLGSPTSQDRKSTRLNSSHSQISYAVFCLKKKKKQQATHSRHLRTP